MRTDELCHYGILGMKWGVRRYQNPDGTRTEAGKRRERKGSEKTKKVLKTAGKAAAGVAAVAGGLFARSAYNEYKGKPEKHINRDAVKDVFSKQDPQQGNTTEAARFSKNVNSFLDSTSRYKAKKKEKERRYKYRTEASRMSDKELKDRVARLNLEKQYVDLSNQKSSDGRWTNADTVEYGRSIANDLLTFGIPAAVTAYKIYKKVKH